MKVHRFTLLTALLTSPAFAQTNTFPTSGSVGIGTTNPGVKTEIANGGSPYNLYLSGNAPSLYFGPASGVFPNDAANSAAAFIGFSTFDGAYGQTKGDLNIATQSWGTGNSSNINFLVPTTNDGGGYAHAMRITRYGNVGIGTTNPTHKLAVNGTIKAKEVIVETTGWSDYVFADDYALQPLSQVEAHIKEHKHLPGIPSASAVATNGVNVGDLQVALLAKVEELTLHLIAQEKELARLRETEKDIAALRTEITQLRQAK